MAVLTNTMMQGTSADTDDAGDYSIKKSFVSGREEITTFRHMQGVGNQTTFTISVWLKPSAVQHGNNMHIFGAGQNNDYFHIRYGGVDDWRLTIQASYERSYDFGGGVILRPSYRFAMDNAAWHHLTVAVDTNQSNERDRIKVYINGRIQTDFESAGAGNVQYPHRYVPLGVNAGLPLHLMSQWKPSGPETDAFDGLVSDYYLIDGLQLSASAFGKLDSSGNWIPTDFVKPTPNNNTEWSSTTTAAGGGALEVGPKANLFDGDITGDCQIGNNDGLMTLTTGTFPIRGTLRFNMRGFTSNYSHEHYVQINDDMYEFWLTEENEWIDIPLRRSYDSVTTFKYKFPGSAEKINAIEVDGVILKDNTTDLNYADWKAAISLTAKQINRAIEWSSSTHSSGSGYTNIHNAFQENPTANWANITGHYILTPPATIQNVWKIEVLANQSGNWSTNTNNQGTVNRSNTAGTNWIDVTESQTTFSSLRIDETAGGGGIGLRSIRINGVHLVDMKAGNVDNTNSFKLDFSDDSTNQSPGLSSLGDNSILKAGGYNDDPNASSLVLAVPGNTLTDQHHNIRTGSSQPTTIVSGDAFVVKASQTGGFDPPLFPCGAEAIFLHGSGTGRLRFEDTDFDFGTGDFCIEGWAMPMETENDHQCIFNTRNDSGTGGFRLTITQDNKWNIDGDGTDITDGAGIANDDVWHHFAVTRASGTMKLWINGSELASGSNTSDFDSGECDLSDNSKPWYGYIQDFRVYKGIPKYTSAFNPPVGGHFRINGCSVKDPVQETWPSAGTNFKVRGQSYGPSSNGSAYLQGSVPSTYYTERNGYQLTGQTLPAGNPAHYRGNCLECDMGGVEVFLDNDASDDFFIGGWFRFPNLRSSRQMAMNVSSNYQYMELVSPVNGKAKVKIRASGTDGATTDDYEIIEGKWHHLALGRNGDNMRLFVDGSVRKTLDVSNTSAGAPEDSTVNFFFAGGNGTPQWNGYETCVQMMDIFCYTGSAPTSNFTAPTDGAVSDGGGAVTQVGGMNSGNLRFMIPCIGSRYERQYKSITTDTPSNTEPETDTRVGAEFTGNFPTFDAHTISANTGAKECRKGNLEFDDSNNSSSGGSVVSTMATPKTGKWYCEVDILSKWKNGAVTGHEHFGIVPVDEYNKSINKDDVHRTNDAYTLTNQTSGTTIRNKKGTGDDFQYTDVTMANSLTDFDVGDTVGIAIDCDTPLLTFYKNGTSVGTFSYTIPSDKEWLVFVTDWNNAAKTVTYNINFGQKKFRTAAPAGYKCLCSTNLPDTFSGDQVNNPGAYFDASAYRGTGALKDVNYFDFKPALLWAKSRDSDTSSALVDAARGAGYRLRSSSTNGQSDERNQGTVGDTGLYAFNSKGFSVGGQSESGANDDDFTIYAWHGGDSAATASTDGSITPSAQWVNATAGFSVSTYTGTGSNATVGHGLSAVPEFVMIKNYGGTGDWAVYHKAMGNTKWMKLNSTATEVDDNTYWNDTSPTNTTVSIGTSTNVNNNNSTYVMYAWTPIPGFSAFGWYDGASNFDSWDQMIHCGFKPRLVIIKRHDGDDSSAMGPYTSWYMTDTYANPHNERNSGQVFFANKSKAWGFRGNDAAHGGYMGLGVMANGFKLLWSNQGAYEMGATADTDPHYLFAAFADFPLKVARGA